MKNASVNITVLDFFDKFAFSLIFSSKDNIANEIKKSGMTSTQFYEMDKSCLSDVRLLYLSESGPKKDYSAKRKAFLFFDCASSSRPFTIVVSSAPDGHGTMIRKLSKTLCCKTFLFKISRMDALYPGNFIWSWQNGEVTRAVYAMKDGKNWVYWEKGIPLEFENTNYYEARLKKDRLTPNIISEYLAKIGHLTLDAKFWISEYNTSWLLAQEGFRIWRQDSGV